MGNCCHAKQKDLEETARRHRKVLWAVLIINIAMFFVELLAGILAGSLALTGDSLDMLGDGITYGSSLLVVGMPLQSKARVAKLKAWIMLIFGLIISAKCIYRSFFPVLPDFTLMLSVGTLALCANLFCLFILTRSRDDDINMRSVWICSRNDIVANTSVLFAAFTVLWLGSPIPDLVVGILLTILFTRSAMSIFKEVELVSQESKSLKTQAKL